MGSLLLPVAVLIALRSSGHLVLFFFLFSALLRLGSNVGRHIDLLVVSLRGCVAARLRIRIRCSRHVNDLGRTVASLPIAEDVGICLPSILLGLLCFCWFAISFLWILLLNVFRHHVWVPQQEIREAPCCVDGQFCQCRLQLKSLTAQEACKRAEQAQAANLLGSAVILARQELLLLGRVQLRVLPEPCGGCRCIATQELCFQNSKCDGYYPRMASLTHEDIGTPKQLVPQQCQCLGRRKRWRKSVHTFLRDIRILILCTVLVLLRLLGSRWFHLGLDDHLRFAHQLLPCAGGHDRKHALQGAMDNVRCTPCGGAGQTLHDERHALSKVGLFGYSDLQDRGQSRKDRPQLLEQGVAGLCHFGKEAQALRQGRVQHSLRALHPWQDQLEQALATCHTNSSQQLLD
mmetsp:Transcript_122006/g.390088  ORF Transcript_122006/g.390088 Transcript_122006/m.390088 type:complete len:404 (+) Transcript_122006:1012-2223(+)